MNVGVKKLGDGDLSRMCGFNGHTGRTGHFDWPDKFEMLRGCWQQEPWAYSARNTCGVSPTRLCAIIQRYCSLFLRSYMQRYVCKLSWRRIFTSSLIMLFWSKHSGNAIQTRTTRTLHTWNIFQQPQRLCPTVGILRRCFGVLGCFIYNSFLQAVYLFICFE